VPKREKEGYLWNIGPWLKRLGFGSVQLDIAPEIVPVQILGDASALTTPLLPPFCWAGSTVAAVALQAPGLAIRSGAPGGTFVRSIRFSQSGVSPFGLRWEISNTPHVFGTPAAAPILQQMGPIDANPIVRFGTTIPSIPATSPATLEGGNLSLFLDEFYLAPGRELFMETTGVNGAAQLSVLLHDVEGQIPNEQAT